MKIEFQLLPDYSFHVLGTKSDDGLEIEILFNGLDAEYIYISGHEMMVASDDYKGLYVRFGEIVPIEAVIEEANKQIEGIVTQTEQEDVDEEAMASDLSSPYYSGGI